MRLLLPMAAGGDRIAGDTAIDFVAYQVNRAKDEGKRAILAQMFGATLDDYWNLVETVIKAPGREAFWFARVLRAAATIDTQRAIKIAAQMMASDDYQFGQEGEKVFGELAQSHPNEAMDAIGLLMTNPSQWKAILFRTFLVLADLPYETVASWLKKVGVDGARAIARHLEPPYLDADSRPHVPPLTEFVLTTFAGDDRTFKEFVAGVHSLQVYVGDASTHHEREGLVARAFLASPIRRVREWAQIELRYAEANAKIERIEEEEFGIS